MPEGGFFARTLVIKLARVVLWSVAVLALLSYGGYRYYLLDKEFTYTKGQFFSVQEQFESVRVALSARLASTTAENNDLLFLLKARSADFQNQIEEVNAKVSELEKFKNTDPELLQKYSRIYFLNENYIPAELSLIEPELLFNKAKPVQIHTKIKTYLENMIRAARAEGVDLSVLSGYRSFGTQAALKSQYSVIYGSSSNSFSADQGYSEHQLGTTLDFTTKKTAETLSGFDKTPAFAWLNQNAHRYGFVLSYPKGNAYYVFEPWHWRFVGLLLATELKGQNKYFYDLPQRDIDSYLIKIFD